MTESDWVIQNRATRRWTRRELIGRILWGMFRPLFRFSPQIFWGWRVALLRLFGAKIGRRVQIYPTVDIIIPWNIVAGDESAIGNHVILYALGPISLGKRVTVSQGAHLCAGTHDWRRADRPLLKPPIVIDDDSWICADAFIGPAVKIGAGAIVGARAVVMKDVAPGDIMVGNPARRIQRNEG
jgi:putative colanic acid biosynthesis acetyltransferase WcaF